MAMYRVEADGSRYKLDPASGEWVLIQPAQAETLETDSEDE